MTKASEFNKTLSHYSVSFSNSKGNNLIYDSETDTIIDGDSEEEEQDEEKKEEQQEDEKEKEKEDEKEDEKEYEKEKEDEGSDTDSTGPNDSSNFISYSSLFFLALLLLIQVLKNFNIWIKNESL